MRFLFLWNTVYIRVRPKASWVGLICRIYQHYHRQWLPETYYIIYLVFMCRDWLHRRCLSARIAPVKSSRRRASSLCPVNRPATRRRFTAKTRSCSRRRRRDATSSSSTRASESSTDNRDTAEIVRLSKTSCGADVYVLKEQLWSFSEMSGLVIYDADLVSVVCWLC